MTFSVYAIDATHLKLIENDGKAVLVGDVFSQPTATFPSATLSFTMADVDVNTQTALAVGGTVNSDGSSMLTSGAEDFNNAGTIDNGTTTSTAFSGSFVASPSSNTNGRFQVSLSNFLGGGVFAAYPSSGGILMLEIDSGLGAGITGGVAMAQSSPTGLVASQGYGMNLTGIDIVNGTGLDQVAQFDTTSSNLTHGTIFYNDFGIANPNDYGVSNSSTYTPGSGGTGEAVLNFNGGSEAAVYYGVNSTTSLALGVDSGDVSLGVIEQQGSPTSTADVAQRHLALLKASALAHAARKKKQQ
jgi:Lhr-like helicase